ncbi:unnamed protein product, partial [Chrysoparadoxa australica]
MGKKPTGVNTKVEAAKKKQAELEAGRSREKAKAEEAKLASEWEKGSNKRGKDRELANDERAKELAAAKELKKKLLDEENAALVGLSGKGAKGGAKKKQKEVAPWEAALAGAGKKKTRWERQQELEKEKERKRKEEAKLAGGRDIVEAEPELTENVNRVAGVAGASGLDAAMASMGINAEGGAASAHPEKRMKAAYKAYEERELVTMRQERPG